MSSSSLVVIANSFRLKLNKSNTWLFNIFYNYFSTFYFFVSNVRITSARKITLFIHEGSYGNYLRY
jgi:hypothetical protein